MKKKTKSTCTHSFIIFFPSTGPSLQTLCFIAALPLYSAFLFVSAYGSFIFCYPSFDVFFYPEFFSCLPLLLGHPRPAWWFLGLRHHALALCYGTRANPSPPGERNVLREFRPVYGAGVKPASWGIWEAMIGSESWLRKSAIMAGEYNMLTTHPLYWHHDRPPLCLRTYVDVRPAAGW